MTTKNVVLTDHQAEIITRLVESGRYMSASEVLQEGLRLLASRDAVLAAEQTALRGPVQAGLEDFNAYRQVGLDDADIADMMQELQAKRAAK